MQHAACSVLPVLSATCPSEVCQSAGCGRLSGRLGCPARGGWLPGSGRVAARLGEGGRPARGGWPQVSEKSAGYTVRMLVYILTRSR